MHRNRPFTVRAGTLMLVACAMTACSNKSPAPVTDTSSVINPERSTRGNPAFYEVYGKRYYVMGSSLGYREEGIASWYGRAFHGRPTSSGEIYDMNQLTAAHKTLPIPTWVEVTNLANGRRVIVKVNDRGPFVDGRVIDLSRRAAEELRMVDAGTSRVRVRALGEPATAPAPVLASRSAPRQSEGFSLISEAHASTADADSRAYRPMYVQVGAFSERNNAEKLVERLQRDGFANSFVLVPERGRDRLHRVRIGPIGIDEFDTIVARLQAAGVSGSRLVQDN